MMMSGMKIRSILIVLLSVAIVLYVALGTVVGADFSFNALLAYITLLLVMGSSFYSSYAKLKASAGDGVIEEREELDQIGDRYGVFEEETEAEDAESETAKEEQKKSRPKIFTWSNIMLGSKLFFSLYRLLAYGVMIIAVLYLIRHEIFNPYGFIAGILAAFLAVLALLGVSLKRENTEN